MTLRFSDKFLHVFIFGNVFPEGHSFVAIRSQVVYKYKFLFIPIQLVKGDEIVGACDRHSNETVALRKHVIKYKNM